MSKTADRYFKVHPWQVVEEGFNPAYAQVSESIFSLANEVQGLRGFAEEGYAPGITSLVGSYLGGVYELEGDDTPGGYKGIVKQSHYMVNAANYLKTEVWVDGERVVLGESAEDFVRTLDMSNGRLKRIYTTVINGKRIRLSFERILCMRKPEYAAQRLTVESDSECSVHIKLFVDGNQPHLTNNLCRWEQVDSYHQEDTAGIRLQTATTQQHAWYHSRVAHSQAVLSHREICQEIRIPLKPGQAKVIEKQICVQISRGDDEPDLSSIAFLSFGQILEDNQAHYDLFWRTGDVVIKGDPENQQGIRYCIFQLHQTYRGFDPRHNIGAKGLTGEAYNGHAFWDTETYCLPYYLLNDLKAAKNLLMFRYHTLKEAKARAKQLDCEGACYPIATLNGQEACALWQHASLQMQPSTAVAHGIWHYALRSGDTAFLYKEGLEMLIEICRYLATRGNWNQDGTGYGYYGVMGPDEFHLMVNNNFYTNYMAQRTFQFTLDLLELADQKQVSKDEANNWRRMSDNMILHYRDGLVYEQHEGYFNLPHINVRSIPRSQFPLYEHWSYDRIYRYDMIKQPDVLMAMFLHPAAFSQDVLAANYDYYEPRCIHESSLSPSVHAILAASLGRHEEAARFFGFSTRLDLDNYNRNTHEGLHLTSIAAAWVSIVYGFGGLRSDGPVLSLSPMLPAGWQSYQFCFKSGASWVKAEVIPDGCRLSLLEGPPVKLLHYGVETEVT